MLDSQHLADKKERKVFEKKPTPHARQADILLAIRGEVIDCQARPASLFHDQTAGFWACLP